MGDVNPIDTFYGGGGSGVDHGIVFGSSFLDLVAARRKAAAKR